MSFMIRTQNTKVLTEGNTVENSIYETTAIVSQLMILS